LANLVNEAALLAVRREHDKLYMMDLEDAKDKVMLGAERKSMVMKEDERRLTAYHEAGHALCAMKVAGNDPLHKVTIVPRGRALGPILVGDNEQELFLGREIQHRREVSEQTAQLVDAEVKRVITNAYERAKDVLSENIDLLHTMAAALLERETLTADDIRIMG